MNDNEEVEKALKKRKRVEVVDIYAKYKGNEYPAGKATLVEDYGILRPVSEDFVLIHPTDIIDLVGYISKPISAYNTLTESYIHLYFPDFDMKERPIFYGMEIGVSYSSRFHPFARGILYNSANGLIFRSPEYVANISRKNFWSSKVDISVISRLANQLYNMGETIVLDDTSMLVNSLPGKFKSIAKTSRTSNFPTVSEALHLVALISKEWGKTAYERASKYQITLTNHILKEVQNERTHKTTEVATG